MTSVLFEILITVTSLWLVLWSTILRMSKKHCYNYVKLIKLFCFFFVNNYCQYFIYFTLFTFCTRKQKQKIISNKALTFFEKSSHRVRFVRTAKCWILVFSDQNNGFDIESTCCSDYHLTTIVNTLCIHWCGNNVRKL